MRHVTRKTDIRGFVTSGDPDQPAVQFLLLPKCLQRFVAVSFAPFQPAADPISPLHQKTFVNIVAGGEIAPTEQTLHLPHFFPTLLNNRTSMLSSMP